MATPTAGWILRIGSYAGIAGTLLGLVGNLLHRHWGPEGVAHTIADSRLCPDHLAIALGLILMIRVERRARARAARRPIGR